MAGLIPAWSNGVAGVVLTIVIGILIVLYLLPGRRRGIADAARLGKDPGLFGFHLPQTLEYHNRVGWREALLRSAGNDDEPYYLYALDRTIMPARYLQELSMLPESFLSHRESINKRHLGRYNGMNVIQQGHVHSDVTRVQLTNSLGALLPQLDEELHCAVTAYMGLTGDAAARSNAPEGISNGQTMPLYDLAYSLVARMTSYAYVGLPLAREEKWLKLVADHPKLMGAITASLKKWPPYLRPLVAPHLACRKRLNAYRQDLHTLLGPIIQERREKSRLPKAQRPLDMFQWLADTCKGEESTTDNIISKLMFLNLAALNTTAATVVHIVSELCQRRDYIPVLREEALRIQREETTWSTTSLRKLRKLDSFMKEIQRLNPPGHFGFARVAMRPIKLSDGLIIPKGESIGVATSILAHDPAKLSQPELFDGFRFEKLRDQAESSELLFTGTGQVMMSWGVGRLTCPGRWYADAQIKLIMAMLLTEYEFAFPAGQEKKLENMVVGDMVMPARDQQIVLGKLSM